MARVSRSYELTLGLAIDLDDTYWCSLKDETSLVSLDDYYSTEDPDAYQITTHHITYRITKKEEGNNKIDISVNNLSSAARSYLIANKSKDLTVYLKLGYDGVNKMAFQGTITNVTMSKSKGTSITRILATDGGMNTKKAFTSRVYPAGTKAQRIVDNLITDLGMPKGYVSEIPSDSVTADPFTVVGNTERNLTRFLKGEGYTGTINNGTYYVLPINTMASTQAAYLSSTTGLKSVKILGTENALSEVTDTDTSEKTRVRFTCQMDASIIPQASVYILDEDEGIDSAFKVEKCILAGSYASGGWEVIADAVELDATITV